MKRNRKPWRVRIFDKGTHATHDFDRHLTPAQLRLLSDFVKAIGFDRPCDDYFLRYNDERLPTLNGKPLLIERHR